MFVEIMKYDDIIITKIIYIFKLKLRKHYKLGIILIFIF